MAQRIGQRTLRFDNPPAIRGYASVVGKKEDSGPLSGTFDVVSSDSHFGQKSWELAESKMQQIALETAVKKASYQLGDLQMILAGDLLNQCIGSAFASVQSNVPYLGLYGACSTMAEGLAVGACLTDGGCADRLAASASSHFCSAERQYRFPLAYGGQRPPTAQWTATASGSVVLDRCPGELVITHATVGQMVEMGVKDANNMGAAMAPADEIIDPYIGACRQAVFCSTKPPPFGGASRLSKNYSFSTSTPAATSGSGRESFEKAHK